MGAIDSLKKILEFSGIQNAVLPSYETELNRALEEWSSSADRATTKEELTGPSASVLKQLADLKARAEADASDPAKLKDAASEAKLAEIDGAFRTADNSAGEAIATLTESNYDAGDSCTVQLDKLRGQFLAARKTKDLKAAQKAVTAIEALGTEAADQARSAETERTKVIRQFHEKRNALATMLSDLERSEKANKACGEYAAIVTGLKDKLIMLARVGGSADPSALTIAIADIEALQTEARKLILLFDKLTKKTKMGPNDLTIDGLTKRLDDIKLRDDDVKTYEATALAALGKKQTTIRGAIGTAMLSESDKEITDFAAEWSELKVTAGKRKLEVTNFLADIALTSQDFIKTTNKGTYPAYFAAITARLEALKTAATDAKETDQKELDQIKKEIAENAFKGQSGLRQADQVAEADVLAGQLAQKQWVSDLAAFQGKLKALDKVAAGITDPEKKQAFLDQKEQTKNALGAIKKREKTAKKQKTPPPYETMSEQLLALVTNVNNMIRYPMGLETHARGQIMEVVKAWDEEVKRFHTLLDGLTNEIGAAMGEDGRKDEVVGKVRARIQALKQVVAPNTITPLAKAVVGAGENKGAAREAREIAMREVLRLRSIVQGTAFKPTALNPFKVDVKTALSALSASLFDIETNLTISL
jgi:hypothetical protein